MVAGVQLNNVFVFHHDLGWNVNPIEMNCFPWRYDIDAELLRGVEGGFELVVTSVFVGVGGGESPLHRSSCCHKETK